MNAPRPAMLSFLRSTIVALMFGGAVGSVQADPVVSNLTASQRAGTKLVDITYDLAAPGFGAVAVTLEASSDGGTTWTVPVASATGAVGESVTPGTGKAIVWNAGVDWPLSYSTQMRFRVVADDGFSYIPGGSFTMGRTSGDTDSNAPPITVTVSPFYIQQTETTKAQWDEVRTWALNNGYTDLAVAGGKASNHPVHSVSWWDVVKWCNARSEMEGLTPVYTVSGAVMRTGTTEPVPNWSANGYRLPTEAEWEKAARGGVEGKRFPWGTDTINHGDANYVANSNSYSYDTSGYTVNTFHPSYTAGEFPYTSPVRSFEANGYGLFDMAGNVLEWCWDWYGNTYYTTSNGATDPRGPQSGPNRVLRGGRWNNIALSARSANRGFYTPGTSNNNSGFRPSRTHLVDGMSLIPGGSFTMGVTSGDTDANAPSITVTVSPFFIQQTETTKAQWDEVRTWALNNGYTDLAVGAGKASNHPVHSVSWWDVVKWCNARSEMEGLTPVYTVSGAVMRTGTTAPVPNWSVNGYRLPTEAEWEKAARGGVEGKRFPWGTDTISHAEANYQVYSQNGTTNFYNWDVEPRPPATGTNYYHPSYIAGGTPYTSPVRSFESNGYGLYDMAGNVWEWCWDRNGAQMGRLIRGGSWQTDALTTRCANRASSGTPEYSNDNQGFRPARTAILDGMSLVPSGSFTMGRTSGDTDSNAPSITVAVSAFYIQQTETTKFQWDEVRTWALSNGYTDLAAGAGWTSTHPIQTVSWWDVVKWCNARSEMEGLIPVFKIEGSVMRTGTTVPTVDFGVNGYRLPTEAEWEKAARGGTSGKRFPWATDTINHNNANYYANSIALNYDTSDYTNYTYHPNYANGSMPYTAPVGSFPSNGFGLYDMSGNVWEWCLDWFGSSVYSDGSINPIGPISGTKRVVRGGSWFNDGNFSRCAIRLNNPPGNRYFDGGFRTVRKEIYSSTGILESGNLVTDTTEPPFIKDATNAEIFATGATLGGNVTSDGGATIIERGVVYSATTANPDPLIGGTGVTKVTATGTTGVFTAPVTGLNQGTGYSYKAYATNSQGTTYSTVATFTTLSTNADLSALTLSSGTLSPTFASATTSYTASVSNATTSLTVTATRAQANATIDARVNTGAYAAVTGGSPSASLPLNVGSNIVDVRVTAQDGTTQKTYTVTVTRDKAAQTITFPNPGPQLANATVDLSATGGGSGNPVTFTIEGPATLGGGNVLSFTGAGSVTVRANQAGNDLYHPAPEVSRTLTVTKATGSVTLGSLSQTYDGTPKAATGTTDPVGKTVNFNYEGGSTAPTNAGSYEVVGTIDDPIYQGNAMGTLEIAKASQVITFAAIPDKLTTDTVALAATGGSSGNTVTFAVTEGPATITNGVLSFTGAGNVTITASQAGNANYEAATPVSRTFTVTKANATVTLANLSQTYDGTPRPATATTDPVGKTVTFTYEDISTAPTNAGSYAVVATIDDPIYQGSATGMLQIAKASQVITFANPGPQLANATVTLSATGGGSGNPVTFAVEGPAALGIGNVLTFTGPGSVTVRANQTGNANYEDAVEVSHIFTVSKATATITLSRLHQVADGTAREVVVTTVPEDLEITVTYDGEADAPIAPGSYAVVATSADDRYEGSASGTLVVDVPARSVRVPGGGLPALSALGELIVPTFSIGAYEVTGSQWAIVVAWAEANAGYDFAGAGSAASGDRPVTGINWFDAAKWCNARTEWENTLLGKSLASAYKVAGVVYKTGVPASPDEVNCDFGAGGYRLPTAAEWEYAARGGASGTPSTYPGGNTLDDLGWYDGNSNGAVQPAGGKTANGLGLYDLAGNAAEWTWDAPVGAPAQRLLRGGAWSSGASACELTALSGETPALRLDHSGFRLARSISLALAAALDDPNLAWESGGDEAWFAQTGMTHDGIDAAESGAVAPGQSSWLETTVTGPCNLRFRWEASQRAALDVFRLETGVVSPLLLTGPANWEERLVELPAGDHTLRWVFARDAASTGTSRVRLDAVSVTPATLPTVTTAAASEVSGSGATFGGQVTADGGRTVTARGVVYATSRQPTLASPGVLTAATVGTGTFSVTATGLTEGTTYFARAYATNHLGTAYGAEIVFTTDTNVVFVEGLAILERGIRSGDTHRFGFTLGGPRVLSYLTTGAGGLEVSLHDGAGALLKSHASAWDLDEDVVLEPGTYELRVRRPAGGTAAPQPFTLTLDERTVAVVRPDAMVGGSLAFLGGANVYTGPLAQQLRLTSPKARAVTAYAAVTNRGNRPDRFAWRGNGDSRHFRVDYRNESGARVSGAVRSGLYRTAEHQPGAPSAWLRILVTPERRLLVVSRNGRTVTLRKVHTVLLDARSVVDPSVRDGVSIRVETR